MQTLKPELRERILTESERLFYENGFRGTSMRAISEATGTTASNLYKYFGGKEELFTEVVGAYAARFLLDFRRELSHSENAEFDGKRIEHMVRGLSEALAESPRRFVILLRGSEGSPYEGFRDELASGLESHMVSGIPGAQGGDPLTESLARNLFEALADIARAGGGRFGIQKKVGRLFRYHMAGMAALGM
jgi:AcrR family transcriptional regulator